MKTNHILINIVLLAALLLVSCSSRVRVESLQTKSQTVRLGEAKTPIVNR
jgi:outer membrane murein-binding lipoprotein Lpp